jgi:hypothetical protein
MGEIYRRAKLVLVWLGLEGENSAEVFAYLHRNRIQDFDINQDLTIESRRKIQILESLVGDELILLDENMDCAGIHPWAEA